MTPSTSRSSATTSGVPPPGDIVRGPGDGRREASRLSRSTWMLMRRPRPLRMAAAGCRSGPKSTPLMRVWAVKGTNFGVRGRVRRRAARTFFGQHDDGAAFRRFVGQRGELRGVGQAFAWSTPGAG
jgi:hypothetical protein